MIQIQQTENLFYKKNLCGVMLNPVSKTKFALVSPQADGSIYYWFLKSFMESFEEVRVYIKRYR